MRAPVSVLAGFINNGDDLLNVTQLSGWVTDPSNFLRVYANLTATKLSQSVEPGGEASLEFPWELALDLPHYPFPLRVAVTAAYHDDRKNRYVHVVFNETLLFTGPRATQDVTGIAYNAFTWLVVIAAAALLSAAAPSVRKAFANVPALNGLARGGAAAPAPAAKKASDADDDFGGLRKGMVQKRK